ncbi:MAG: hypothetical protein KDH15_01525 [Rhodocyclaceae bacterium]|nr:hypothetical protein [Rhodocyclaceae bacterium]
MARLESRLAALVVGTVMSTAVHALPVTLTKLTGVTGGVPAATAVYRAELGAIGIMEILSLSIRDVSGGFGGAAGQFSGFDLDAAILSNVFCASAACAAGLSGLPVFDYLPSGTIFNAGAQRPPFDAKLFGSDASGTEVDDIVATLGIFDGNATTVIPGADGFISLGDFGQVIFNLVSPVSSAGLFLYIGEVGDNGEVAGSAIDVSDRAATIPEPSALALVAMALSCCSWMRLRSQARGGRRDRNRRNTAPAMCMDPATVLNPRPILSTTRFEYRATSKE